MKTMTITMLDWSVLAAYFVVAIGIGVYFARKEKTSKDFFMGGKSAIWFVIGGSLFGSNIGAEHLIGLAGGGAASGLAIGMFELMAIPCLLILGWVFLPYYLRTGVMTMPEFLERRFNPQCRVMLSSVSLVAYVLTKISVSLYAGGILIQHVLGLDITTSAIILVIITGVYAASGGLSAVLYNNVLEAVILITGTLALTLIGLGQVGGLAGLEAKLSPGYFDMIRPMTDASFPWTGTIIGILILGTWYWCTDQVIVQRTLAGKNLNHARGGVIFASFLKLMPILIFVVPGMIAVALWPAEVSPSGGKPDMAFPLMVTRLMPSGMAGLMIAALTAAVMSSLSSVFNSCSTLVTMDFYRKLRPAAPEKRLVLVGRLTTVVIVGISLLWIPMITRMSSQVYMYLQNVQAYVGAPIAAVFLVGIAWRGVTGRAAFVTLILGGFLGCVRFGLDFAMKTYSIAVDQLGPLGIFYGFSNTSFMFSFLNFGIILFLVCVACMAVVTFMTRSHAVNGSIYAPATTPAGGMPVRDEGGTLGVWLAVHILLSLLVMGLAISICAHYA